MESGMISVDRWGNGSQAYFLTHLHADHTHGLSPSWRRGPLFCSRVSAILFPSKFPGFDLSLLRVVDVGNWYSLSLLSHSSTSSTDVHFMPLDAHHCPGAVMYLFRGEFGCQLHTGDFRWEERSDRALIGREMLLNALKDVKLDFLYLDNTYCNPSYSFPSREVAARQVVNIIASYPKHDIVIAIDSLGKENLLVYISRVLKIKIWVWPERLQTMHLLGFRDIFTTKTSLTRVRAIPRYSFSIETLEALNIRRPTIGIMPSGLPWLVKKDGGNTNTFGSSRLVCNHDESSWHSNAATSSKPSCPNKDSNTFERYHQYIYTVPYSDHSCFAELQDFVKLLKPVNIKGIVTKAPCCINPMYYFGHLCGTKQASKVLHQKPETIRIDRVEAARIKSSTGSGDSRLKRKKSVKKLEHATVHVGRVSILRRVQRGAKILDTDCID
nr:5' exonuclease Apollo [Ipomoea batatas]GMD08440.1 5' exonuclease Apollo [Ipomoea batatas]GMD10970.1 5' exonuclease Apollo [Ipomoea batatas]